MDIFYLFFIFLATAFLVRVIYTFSNSGERIAKLHPRKGYIAMYISAVIFFAFFFLMYLAKPNYNGGLNILYPAAMLEIFTVHLICSLRFFEIRKKGVCYYGSLISFQKIIGYEWITHDKLKIRYKRLFDTESSFTLKLNDKDDKKLINESLEKYVGI